EDKDYEIALGKALNYLSHRQRSIFEMKGYLKKKETSPQRIEKIIEKLSQWGYLDDLKFAKAFVAARKKSNPKSKFALGYELRAKGIDQSTIDNALEAYDDNEMALYSVQLKMRRWMHLEPEVLKKKLTAHLQYRGFNYGNIIFVQENLKIGSDFT
ncbi:MAG: RecX family transcriptional regulator, partial [Desulfovibrionales bacterium]|nr:RecX family transcriptional regulator [Desulfovibrionales bacterium]